MEKGFLDLPHRAVEPWGAGYSKGVHSLVADLCFHGCDEVDRSLLLFRLSLHFVGCCTINAVTLMHWQLPACLFTCRHRFMVRFGQPLAERFLFRKLGSRNMMHSLLL